MPSTLDYPLELVARVLHARFRGAGEQQIQRVCTDSRQVQPGDLFFALCGENHDGHQFVPDAFRKGAVGAVVSGTGLASPGAQCGLLEVRDPLAALGALAAWHRLRCKARVVAVTGSVGKTTTKDLLAGILAQQWNVLKSPGNQNSEIGLPLALLQLSPEHDVAVLEMGMRGPGQIRYLAELARPDMAIITHIGLSHLEMLGSRDAIAEAKAEVLDYLPSGGTAVLNVDDVYYSFLVSRVPTGAEVATFGSEGKGHSGVAGAYLGCGSRPGDKSANTPYGTRFTVRAGLGQNVKWGWVPLLGRHNMMNALAAAAAAQALGVTWPRVNRGLDEAEVSTMRMSVHQKRDASVIIDDAYNASSPEGMLSALEVLAEIQGLRKIAVLGSMLELGPAAEEAHREVGRTAARLKPTLLMTVGEEARGIADAAIAGGMPADRVIVCADNEETLAGLLPRRRPGDVILVKGSRGMKMERVVSGLLSEGPG